MSWRSPLTVAVQRLLRCVSSPKLAEFAAPDSIAILQRRALSTLQNLPNQGDELLPEAAKEVCTLSALSVALAAEVGLSSAEVAELVSMGLAVAAALFALPGQSNQEHLGGHPKAVDDPLMLDLITTALEPLGAVLDCFAVDIFSGLRRLEDFLRPRWNSVESKFVFGALEAEGEGALAKLYLAEVRHYYALQGVCIWSLALAVRAAGHGQFTAPWLWEFASSDPFCAVILAKGSLCFCEGTCEESPIQAPCDLPALKEAILRAVFGLSSPDVAFLDSADNSDVPIEMQNKHLARHRASLASVVADCALLDCLTVCPWGPDVSYLPAFASFLADLLGSCTDPSTIPYGDTLMQQIRHCSKELWEILSETSHPTRGFLEHCAALAYRSAPSPEKSAVLLQAGVQASVETDSHSHICHLASLIAFASNAGCIPADYPSLVQVISNAAPDARQRVAGRLQCWRGCPLQTDMLSQWTALLGEPVVEESVDSPLKDTKTSPLSVPSPARAQELPSSALGSIGGLRKLVGSPPPEFRCMLDGGLLVDPVRSPSGHVFERSALTRALETSKGCCPITGAPLALNDCQRDAELRVQILRWVRESRPRQRA